MAGAKSHGQVRALPASGRTVVLALMLASCAGVLYLVARPLYWRFYAEFIHSYEPDPALTLIRRAQEAAGVHRSHTQLIPHLLLTRKPAAPFGVACGTCANAAASFACPGCGSSQAAMPLRRCLGCRSRNQQRCMVQITAVAVPSLHPLPSATPAMATKVATWQC